MEKISAQKVLASVQERGASLFWLFVTELVGEVRLKGKEHGTRIYRVLGRRDGGPGEQRDEAHETSAIEEKPARIASGAPR